MTRQIIEEHITLYGINNDIDSLINELLKYKDQGFEKYTTDREGFIELYTFRPETEAESYQRLELEQQRAEELEKRQKAKLLKQQRKEYHRLKNILSDSTFNDKTPTHIVEQYHKRLNTLKDILIATL
jgi:hypothetical protein